MPTLILALDTLQTFNFTGHTFTRVIRACVLPYLAHGNRDLRLKACETCCALLAGNDEGKGRKKAASPSPSAGDGASGGGDKTVVHHQSNESVGFIAEVLQALIGVVIVDKGAAAAFFRFSWIGRGLMLALQTTRSAPRSSKDSRRIMIAILRKWRMSGCCSWSSTTIRMRCAFVP